ncbi:MAG: hypothetical protein J6Q55_01140, partial [Clostridia bacterium]|nr:hypothetical protein [Clostridia bacterium]
FYKGFPETVRKLTTDELLFDQLLHYFTTYGLGLVDEPGHSLMEEAFERTAFKEDCKIKEFKIVDEQTAIEEVKAYVQNLLLSSRPLNAGCYQVVREAIADYDVTFDQCACKDTAIKLLLDERNPVYSKFLYLNDFVKLVEYLNYYDYTNLDIKKLNLKNKDRVFLTKVLDRLLDTNFSIDTCMEKRQAWVGILHHIHYKPKTAKACKFADAIFKGANTSALSRFEKLMADGNIKGAVDLIIKEKGSAGLLRKLNYILSRCTNEENTKYVLDRINSDKTIVVIQLMLQYANYRSASNRVFKFPKFNLLRVHNETNSEMAHRRSIIGKNTVATIVTLLQQTLANNLKGKLGKVYVDEGMKNIALPLQETASFTGYGNLPKGSKIKLEDGKKIRAFTYWEKVNDIDLSIIGITKDGERREFSWRTMAFKQSDTITFSGDQTSGFNGGSEYFDINLDKMKQYYPKYRYYVLCNNVYSSQHFSEVFCKAGYMTRDVVDSGEVFEPKTVASSYLINCDSTFAYLYAIDVVNKEIIWLNLGKNSNQHVAGLDDNSFLFDYFNVTDTINMHSFFTMLATEVVTDSKEADVVVSDLAVETKEGATVIHSYDTDVVLAMLNK